MSCGRGVSAVEVKDVVCRRCSNHLIMAFGLALSLRRSGYTAKATFQMVLL